MISGVVPGIVPRDIKIDSGGVGTGIVIDHSNSGDADIIRGRNNGEEGKNQEYGKGNLPYVSLTEILTRTQSTIL